MSQTTPIADQTMGFTAARLRELLDSGQRLRLVDVRTPGEFAGGHLSGSVNVPLPSLPAIADELIRGGEDQLVLICGSGVRAHTARQSLNRAGGRDIYVLEGGINAWTAAGGATRSRPGGWSMDRQVRLVAGLLVLGGVLASLWWPAARFASGAVGAGLAFAALTNTCGMAKLLARLPHNRGRSCDISAAVQSLRRS